MVHLVKVIQTALTKSECAGALFVDIKNAYENVNLSILSHNLIYIKIPWYIVKTVINLFTLRDISIKNINNILRSSTTSQSIPQGSVLSPLLFNIYTLDFHNIWSNTITSIQYSEDFVLYCTKKNHQYYHITYCLKELCLLNGFFLSTSKSTVTSFSLKRIILPDSITLNGITFPISNIMKYLGIVLDSKLR